MLSDEQILADLTKLRDIVIAHKAPGKPLEVGKAKIDGREMDVFTNIPNNLGEVYALGMATPDREFMVFQKERFTFAETLERAKKIARVLTETYSIEKGDRVAICSRNYPEWCFAYMAITMIGAVVVPMNSWWSGDELEYGLQDSGSKLLFADPERLDRVRPYLKNLGVSVITFKARSSSEFPDFAALIEHTEALTDEEIAAYHVVPEDNVSIMYTSGSTGHPKGVLATHRGIVNALYTWRFVKEINEILRPELVEENPEFEPAVLANVPLFHVTGSHAQFLSCFLYPRKFVMMYKWDPEVALQTIEQERISILHGVPTMTWEVMNSPSFETTDIRSLRSVQAGGAPRPPEHLALMNEKFPEVAIPGLGYGLTETNAIGAIISGPFYQARPNSTGRPTPPVAAVKIVDENDNELEAGEAGEICISGPTLMKGYWNKPEATAEVMKDGWFYTGDIGMLDSLGFLIIMDRAKDIVIRGGENIGCAEVEYAISEHEDVSEVSVYGIPDNRLGEVPVATVMINKDSNLSEGELKEFLAARIAHFKIPVQVFFQHEQLPRIATGKIAKKELRKETIERLGLA